MEMVLCCSGMSLAKGYGAGWGVVEGLRHENLIFSIIYATFLSRLRATLLLFWAVIPFLFYWPCLASWSWSNHSSLVEFHMSVTRMLTYTFSGEDFQTEISTCNSGSRSDVQVSVRERLVVHGGEVWEERLHPRHHYHCCVFHRRYVCPDADSHSRHCLLCQEEISKKHKFKYGRFISGKCKLSLILGDSKRIDKIIWRRVRTFLYA